MCLPQEIEKSTNQTIPPPQPSARAFEAISQYPIARHLTTYLSREDILNLIISHSTIYRMLNVKNRIFLENLLERCIRSCPGPPCWGFPETMSFLKPREHIKLKMNSNQDMDVQMCGRGGCLHDSCKHCRQRPPARSELRRRWVCPSCLPKPLINPCTCASAANIYCQECAIAMTYEDDAYYDFNAYIRSNRIPLEDTTYSKRSDCADYYYSCWDCKVRGTIPYVGLFMCSWCSGEMGYAELHPRDIRQ